MSVLEQIFARKREEVAAAKLQVSIDDLKAQAADAPPTRGFLRALREHPGLALIAEVKKASPSQGLIRPNFDAVEVAQAYERAGATCLSVLTDEPGFQGRPEYLTACRSAVALPLLRKDFLDDPYQVHEARAWGADAALLIAASLSKSQLSDLQGLIELLGMDALVEVHNETELEVALSIGAKLVGVNNRDLADFKTDVAISERLIPRYAGKALAVSESALESRSDLDRVEAAGAKAVLIGTAFCASPDIEAKVKEVMGW